MWWTSPFISLVSKTRQAQIQEILSPSDTLCVLSLIAMHLSAEIPSSQKWGAIVRIDMARKTKKDDVLTVGGETLGARLARLRKQHGYTQSELAKKTGMAQNLISEYESNKKRLHAELIVRLVTALEVSSDELLGLEKSQGIKDPQPRVGILMRIEKLHSMPRWTQTNILRTVDMLIESAERRSRKR